MASHKEMSHYKTTYVRKTYFDFRTFWKGVFFLSIGAIFLASVFNKMSKGYFMIFLLVLIAVFFLLLGISFIYELFTVRDKKMVVLKSDNEILEEMILAEEDSKKLAVKEVKPKIITPVKISTSNPISAKAIALNKEFDSYDSLLDLIRKNKVEYSDLLRSFEWRFKRLVVLERDGYKCANCQKVSSTNHVHHTYYIKDRFPWEIDEKALQTLCSNCHSKLHEREEIPLKAISSNGEFYIIAYLNIDCCKCNGTGYIRKYSHIQKGICFACYGQSNRTSLFEVPISRIEKDSTRYDVEQLRLDYRHYFKVHF